MKPAPFEYHRPCSLGEAIDLLAADPDAKPLAGGQSLVPMLNFRLARPSALVDLGGIDDLAGIRVEDGALVVGAMTRQWDLERAAETPSLLREALAFVGHTATRCRGTVGGSLVHADPTAELAVCAVALGAELFVAGPGGPRAIPAEEFFLSVFMTALEPGELLLEIRFPQAQGGAAFEEHAHRHGDFAVVCVAVAGERVALGGVGATPVLWDGGELDPVGDLFAPAGYKREVALALVERAREQSRMIEIVVTVNGVRYERRVEPRLLLSDFIRHDLSLYGTHVGCEHGVCGACTVLLDGRPARSCLTLAVQADGADLETVESLANGAVLHPLQQAFHEHFGLQCGFCTPGILMTAKFLLERNPDPSEEAIRAELSGNLCRCTGYAAIVDSILAAAETLRL